MKRLALLSLVLVFSSLVPPLLLQAAPQPPIKVVNHETKECASFMGGDECMDCFAPEGWEVVGQGSSKGWCPEGYTEISHLDSTCEPFKDQFCCTEGHSGVHGNCVDLVRHEKKKLCAFVDDINTFDLPKGWERSPEDTTAYSWFCPSGYEWISSPDAMPTPEPSATPTPKPADPDNGSKDGGLPCPAATLLAPAALSVVLVRKRRL